MHGAATTGLPCLLVCLRGSSLLVLTSYHANHEPAVMMGRGEPLMVWGVQFCDCAMILFSVKRGSFGFINHGSQPCMLAEACI